MTDLTTAPADRELLAAFAARGDQAAFAELVRRHGPVVYAACRRVLGDGPDADDAFQAAFVVLAKKAGAVRKPELLGNWLYGVAVRCARRAKTATVRRQAREEPVSDHPAPDPGGGDWPDVRPVLDEELARLPDKLRAVIVLCELEGVPRPEAAGRLGVPEGTLSSRLARAKEALRRRLVKRGIALSAVGLGVVLANAAPAAVPPRLAAAAVGAATGNAAGVVLTLAQAEVNAMFWAKAVKVGLAAAVLAVVGIGAGVAGFRGAAAADDKKTDRDRFQGKWTIRVAKVGGKSHEPLVGSEAVFKDGKATFDLGEGEFKLDPAKDPKEIDLTIAVGTHPGIYKFDGKDKLVIHAAHPGGDRPTDFENVEGTKSILLELERVKEN